LPFTGVMYFKIPAITKTAMHEIKTSWQEQC
jgi:hypothetical protein